LCEDCCGAAAKRSVSTKCTGAFVLCEQCRLLLKADGKTFVLLVSLAVAGGPTSTQLIGRAITAGWLRCLHTKLLCIPLWPPAI
jgi:hypothetical protein